MPRSESNNPLLAEGKYIFEVFEISEPIKTAKSFYRLWKFNTVGGESYQIWQNVFAWEEVPLLCALGYEVDEKGGVDWEMPDIVNSRRLQATVYHETYEGKTRAKVKDFIQVNDDEIPF